MTTSAFLEKHGTKAFRLPPSAILSAAKSDLALRKRKVMDKCEPGLQYAFIARHVRKAECPADLLEWALKERDRGLSSSKINTRLIYGDEDLLHQALARAKEAA